MKRFSQCDYDDSNQLHKKTKHSDTIEQDAVSSTKKKAHNDVLTPDRYWWLVTEYLGKGSYGSVHSAVNTTYGDDEHEDDIPQEIVIKSKDIRNSPHIRNEERLLFRLKSPFVVTCYGHVITEENKKDEDSPTMYYNTFFEYCPNHCLAKHIKSNKGIGLQENDVKDFACDILLGLKYIHGEKIIHRDIKPKNILLRSEGKRIRAKISGFGKAIETESVDYGEGLGLKKGTMRFMCPELLRDNVLDYGADVWAFGCTVLEMLSGERVWGEHSGERVWKDWITLICESNVLPYVPDSLSEEAKDFVYECLKKDPARRASVDSLLEHPFLQWKHDEEEEEEEEERYDAYEAHEEDEEIYEEEEEDEEEEYLQGGEAFGEEQEEIELDEEYPKEDSEEDL